VSDVDHVCSVGATLGEGPWWDAGAACLWFVDIKAPEVLRFTPASGTLERWAAPAEVGWVLPRADGAMLAGVRGGICTFEPDGGAFARVVPVEADVPGNRLNDATVDAAGRLWLGTMDNGERASLGRFYRLDGGRVVDAGLPPCAITNGPAASPDGRVLYPVDTLARRIDRVAIAADGTLGAPQPFLTIEDGAGWPDGPTVDAEGCVWIALFGGWGVRRYSPAGELLQTVALPVANVTKIAFGGPDLRTAYATTARHNLDDAGRAAQPLAGDLFAFRVDVPGLPQVAVV
jgi:xylono-1,5-lactonase